MTAQRAAIGANGQITLPEELRRKYELDAGDVLTVINMDEGVIMLRPRKTTGDELADEMARLMAEAGATLDDMLEELDRQREIYYREHYAKNYTKAKVEPTCLETRG